MKIKQYDVWIADLNPRFGTEPGKTRPVLILQTNLLNNIHPSTIICPITTNIQLESEILRIHLSRGMANLNEDCDIILDQIRAIDNRRLIKRLGKIPDEKIVFNFIIPFVFFMRKIMASTKLCTYNMKLNLFCFRSNKNILNGGKA